MARRVSGRGNQVRARARRRGTALRHRSAPRAPTRATRRTQARRRRIRTIRPCVASYRRAPMIRRMWEGLMQAWRVHGFGEPEETFVLDEVAEPTATDLEGM